MIEDKLMSNPFTKYNGGTYASHIYNQVKNIEVGKSLNVDISDSSIRTFRMTISYLSKKHDIAFQTRTDKDGLVWVKRTA